MKPNNSSIYKENRGYFQILERQKEKRIDRFIRRVSQISAGIRKELAKEVPSPADLQEETKYYQRRFEMDGHFQGNVAGDFQLAQINGKWPREFDCLTRQARDMKKKVKFPNIYELERN